IAGLAVSMRTMKNKRGDTMAFVLLDDRSARIEVALFSDAYEENRDKLLKDSILVVEGVCSDDEYSGGKKMRVRSVRSLAEAREQNARALQLSWSDAAVTTDDVERLKAALTVAGGGRCPVIIDYQCGEGRVNLRLGEQWCVSPSEELISKLRSDYGANNVVIAYD
ncbi:MAG: OB-fold nucleic acid binding domain-containing protein, partial [Spongiibacteraceae bacterium]